MLEISVIDWFRPVIGAVAQKAEKVPQWVDALHAKDLWLYLHLNNPSVMGGVMAGIVGLVIVFMIILSTSSPNDYYS